MAKKYILISISMLSILEFFTGCSDSSLFFHYGYNIRKGQVYYKQPFPNPVIEIKTADAKTFKVLKNERDTVYADDYYYATDKNSAYYYGYPIEGSDGPSFEIVHLYYSKDKAHCYYRGDIIAGTDPATFAVKDNDFSLDKDHIYRRGILIDRDASVFERFEGGAVVHMANTVSVYDAIIPIPVGTSFKYLSYNYFALNEAVYFHDELMPAADPKTFTALDNFTSKTDKHVYYGSKIITNADPASYELIEPPYGKDRHCIFFFERTIKGADVKTFEVVNKNFQCARDKNAVYHEDKRVTAFTPADLVNKNLCTNCNATAIYFAK